jgi:DNA-binding NarL/FixJ family response regulator
MQNIIDRQDGLTLVGGKITSDLQICADKLSSIISRCAKTSGPDELLRVPRHSTTHPYVLCISSELPPRWTLGRSHQPAALITVVEPDAPPPINPSDLAGIYGLTTAEAKVAAGIGCGEALVDIAGRNNTSVNTVRNQLTSIFSKTGFSRQSDLVRMVMNIGRLCRRVKK